MDTRNEVSSRRRRRPATPDRPEVGGSDSVATIADDIFSRIAALEPHLSRAHRTLARAILAEPRRFIETPAEAIKGWLGVSAPTLTRFARACGCASLRELKLQVMGGLRIGLRYFEPESPPHSIDDVVARIVNRAQHAIATTIAALDVTRLQEAAHALKGARVIHAFGSGGVSSWIVEEAQNRLFRLGLTVLSCTDHQMQLMLSATIRSEDMLLCCSLAGRDPELLRAVSVAHAYGARTIALTAPGSPLADAVTIAIPIHASDDGDVLGPTGIRYGHLIALDALAYLVALQGGAPVRDTLRRIKQQLIVHRDIGPHQPLSD